MANATIRVVFGNEGGAAAGEAGTHLSAEIDDRETGYNAGKTSFIAGDTAHFLVFRSANVQVDRIAFSAGSVSLVGSGVSVEKEEELIFEDSDSAVLPIPANGIVSTRFFGNDLGSLTLQSDKMTLKASSKGVAVAKVVYTANADVYALQSPAAINGETDFSILVLVIGSVIGGESP
jgi:hypothetical protein